MKEDFSLFHSEKSLIIYREENKVNLFKIFKMDFMNTAKNPTLFLCNTVFPLIIILIMGFITKGGYGTKVTSYDYYGVTMTIFFVFNIALTESNTFMEKKIKPGNVRLIYSPTHTSNIFLSKILACSAFAAICYTILMVAEDKIFNIKLGGENFIYVLIVILIFTFFMCCFGAFMCCIFKSEEATNKIVSPVLTVLGIFGGVFFPIDSLGSTVQKLSYISPLKWINDCILKIIYDKDFSMFLPTVIALLLGSAVLTLLCKVIFKPEAYI